MTNNFSNKDEGSEMGQVSLPTGMRTSRSSLSPDIFLKLFCFFFSRYKQSERIFPRACVTKRKDNPTADNTHSERVFCPGDKLRRPLNGRFLLWRSRLLRQSPEAGRFTSRVLASFIPFLLS